MKIPRSQLKSGQRWIANDKSFVGEIISFRLDDFYTGNDLKLKVLVSSQSFHPVGQTELWLFAVGNWKCLKNQDAPQELRIK